MSATTTRAPSARNRFAYANPMPAAPPVITATLPSSRMSGASIDDVTGAVKAPSRQGAMITCSRVMMKGRSGATKLGSSARVARVFGAGGGGAHGGGVVEPGDGDAVPGGAAPPVVGGPPEMALNVSPDHRDGRRQRPVGLAPVALEGLHLHAGLAGDELHVLHAARRRGSVLDDVLLDDEEAHGRAVDELRLVGFDRLDGRRAPQRPHGGGVLEPHLGDAVVEGPALAVARGQGVRLHVAPDAGQPGHHLGMLRSPVVLEGLDGELGPAAEIRERLDHDQSSSTTQWRGSTMRKTPRPRPPGPSPPRGSRGTGRPSRRGTG